ncbi:unnamed protein product [Rotaria sordida]|uniref:Uncharacterized protein n=2 Tax=Rotaria sordida TaxID=392033 RepID=A0A813PIH5_9BILA|nr:unnamed protein product [Rotaria sordida]
MLFMFITYILFLIRFSFGDECPSLKYCTCSSDKTIIQCTKRQLTNKLLLKLNNQLSKSTILLNLSSNSLTSINSLSNLNSLQILDLSFNKIQHLPSNIFSKYPQLISLNLQNNSLKTIPKSFTKISNINLNLLNNRFHCTCEFKLFKKNNFFKNVICQNNKPFNENDFCHIKNFLQINPQQSQIAYENEQFILNCSSNLQHYWTLNKKFYPSTMTTFSYSTIIIHHLQMNHSGLWTCHSFNYNHSIRLTVLKSSPNYFCQSIQMNTSKGYFYWPRTSINKKLPKYCPFGSAAWLKNSNEYAQAWYTCSSKGQWINFDISQCAFQTNISRVFDYLSLNETNLLLNLVEYLSEINQDYLQLNDMILLIDLIDEQKDKYQQHDRMILIYHLTDFILQIKKNDFIFSNVYQIAIKRLRLIIEHLLDFTNQSWLYIGKELTAMTIQSSTLCYVPNRSLLTIICDIDNQSHESPLATIQFPSHLNETSQYSLYRIIIYRRSTLFTSNVITNNNNPVIHIRPVLSNNLSTIKLTYYGQSEQASIGIWYSNQSSWQINSSVCKINEQNSKLISTNCILFNNDSLSITYLNHKNIFFHTNYSQYSIYISSLIASTCFFISILVYICFHKVYQMSRCFFHCLINYWFNLAILLPLFAFGMQQNQYQFLCQFIATSLHYLCLTTILWLTLLTYLIWRKLSVISTNKDCHRKFSIMINDGLRTIELKSQPVIQFYLLAYGIALIMCCINIAILHEQYMINKICFFNNLYSILILIISMSVFIIILLFFLLSACNHIKRLTNETKHLDNLSNVSKIKPENILLSKPNEILSILIPFNQNNEQVLSNKNYQHESIQQLLSILFQLILLISLFLSSLSIYLNPLHLFKLRFEHIIYSHLYGFFVLVLSFYIFSYYVLLRIDLIRHYYFNTKKIDHLSNQSNIESSSSSSINLRINYQYDVPSSPKQISIFPSSYSYNSSNIHIPEILQNASRTSINFDNMDNLKLYTKITSDCCICHCHILKPNEISSSQNTLHDTLPSSSSSTSSSLDIIMHEIIDTHQFQHNAFNEQTIQRSMNGSIEFHSRQTDNIHLHSSSTTLFQPRTSPALAIIRLLPNIHFSSRNINKNISNSTNIIQSNDHINLSIEPKHISKNAQNSPYIKSLPFTAKYDATYTSVTQTDHLIQQKSSSNEKLSIWKKSPCGHTQLAYIDQDDEHSVSLKSLSYDSKASSSTILNKKDHIQTLSSSSNFSDDSYYDIIRTNQKKLHESSV